MKINSAFRNVLMLGSILFAQIAAGQTQPAAPAKAPPANTGAYDDWFARAGWVCGMGVSTSPVATKPTAQCGGILSGPFFDFEVGVMGPQANQHTGSVYLSTNAWVPLLSSPHWGNKYGLPLAVGGYTRMFETGNAVDYGVAFAHPVDAAHSIQFEVRDYWAHSNPAQHNVVFRIVWLTGVPD